MKVTKQWAGSVVVLALEGRLTVEEDTRALHQALEECTRQGTKTVVLDLARVPSLDCAGIGCLVTSYLTARRRGATLKLLNVGARPLRLLSLARLLTVIEVYHNDEEVIGSAAAKTLSVRARS